MEEQRQQRVDWRGGISAALLILAAGVFGVCRGAHGQGEHMDLPINPEHHFDEAKAEAERQANGRDTRDVEPATRPHVPDPPPDPTVTFYGEEISSTRLVYLIDVSGSMAGTRIVAAKAQLVASIAALDPATLFVPVSYTWSPNALRMRSPFDRPRAALPGNKAAAIEWVQGLSAGGGTPTAVAVAQAVGAYLPDDIILLTDGHPNQPHQLYGWAAHLEVAVSACEIVPTRCHCFGIEDYGTFTEFLIELAGQTGGVYVHIE